MQLIGCQIDIRWEDRQKNFDKVSELLTSTTVSEGSLIVLPEMFASGFSMNVDRIYEKDPSTTETFLSELAKNYSSTVIGGLVKRHDSGKGLNTLSVYGPDGSALGSYQKNHCFSFTGESDYYLSGEDILTFDWQGLKVCPTICYDLRFPELYRRGVAAGAELFPVIASWPVDRVDHWDTLLKARAIENECYVVMAGCVGNLPQVHNMDIQYAQSAVLTPSDFAFPSNAVKGEATPNTEMTLIVDIDLDLLRELHEYGSVRNMKDRRLELYEIKPPA